MIVRTEQELKGFWEKAKKEERLFYDIESTGLLVYPKRDLETREWMEDRIIGHAFLLPSDASTYYLPVRMETCENLCNEEVLEVCADLFGNPDVPIVGHNLKYDSKMIAKEGVTIANTECTMLMAHLWNENELLVKVNGKESTFGLKAMGVKYFGVDADAESRELHKAAMQYIASDLNALIKERESVEAEMKLREWVWKEQMKDLYREDYRRMQQLDRDYIKAEKKGEDLDVNIVPIRAAIEALRGKINDANHRKPTDHVSEMPAWMDWLYRFEKRNEIMAKIDRMRKVQPMEMLAKLPVELVADYACQDVLLTFRLYSMIRFGKR